MVDIVFAGSSLLALSAAGAVMRLSVTEPDQELLTAQVHTIFHVIPPMTDVAVT